MVRGADWLGESEWEGSLAYYIEEEAELVMQ